MHKGYKVKKISEVIGVLCPCGKSYRPITREETPALNLHVTEITDSAKHYHKNCTEVYYILEGNGIMELEDDEVMLEPGVVILIEPGTRHRSKGNIKALIVGAPAIREGDEYFD